MKISVLITEFCAGTSLSVACFYLIPQSVFCGSGLLCFCGCLTGVLVSLFVQNVIKYNGKKPDSQSRIRASGYTCAIINIITAVPEGMIFGMGFVFSPFVGIKLTASLLLYSLPKSVGAASSLRAGKAPFYGVTAVLMLHLLSLILGLRLGLFIGRVPSSVTGAVSAFIAGAILYSSVGETGSETGRLYHGRLSGLSRLAGMALGAALCYSS